MRTRPIAFNFRLRRISNYSLRAHCIVDVSLLRFRGDEMLGIVTTRKRLTEDVDDVVGTIADFKLGIEC
jgi:hypothetical protein